MTHFIDLAWGMPRHHLHDTTTNCAAKSIATFCMEHREHLANQRHIKGIFKFKDHPI